jgi:hypothetical protein
MRDVYEILVGERYGMGQLAQMRRQMRNGPATNMNMQAIYV